MNKYRFLQAKLIYIVIMRNVVT